MEQMRGKGRTEKERKGENGRGNMGGMRGEQEE